MQRRPFGVAGRIENGLLGGRDLMAMGGKIRVGIVGASASRGFASIAHIPALQALSEFEIAAVCTTRQETAEAAARHYGVPLASPIPRDSLRTQTSIWWRSASRCPITLAP